MASRPLPAQAPVLPKTGLANSLRPGIHALRKLAGFRSPDIVASATEQWVLSERSTSEVRKAKFLPGQLHRITGAQFGTVQDVFRDFQGGFTWRHPPTLAFRLKNVALIDGVLYAGNTIRHLKPRSRGLAGWARTGSMRQAALYESWVGNRWFGNWLSDDCLSYRLAESCGNPVTTEPATGHKVEYERQLGMAPARIPDTWFEELILFDDRSHNEGKRSRAADLRRRLIDEEPARHPGAFLLRGRAGDPRELTNERAIAERLAHRRSFRVIDPSTAPLSEIIETCAGAQVIAGVEGSHLVHGLMLMPPEARALVIQPPDRTVSVLKMITDRQGQDYSFVVGGGNHESNTFTADADEIERTLDLA